MRRFAGRFKIGWQASPEHRHSRKNVLFVAGEPQSQHPPSGYANEKDLAPVGNAPGDELRDQIMDKDQIAARLGSMPVPPTPG